MIIKKDGDRLNVTKGAFSALFANEGWLPDRVVEEAIKNDDASNLAPNTASEKEDDGAEKEEYDIVFEEMDGKALKAYAAELGIELKKGMRRSEVIELIRAKEA